MAPNRSDSCTCQFNLTSDVRRSRAVVFVIIYRLKSRHLRSSPNTRHYITRVITVCRRRRPRGEKKPKKVQNPNGGGGTASSAAAVNRSPKSTGWVRRTSEGWWWPTNRSAWSAKNSRVLITRRWWPARPRCVVSTAPGPNTCSCSVDARISRRTARTKCNY